MATYRSSQTEQWTPSHQVRTHTRPVPVRRTGRTGRAGRMGRRAAAVLVLPYVGLLLVGGLVPAGYAVVKSLQNESETGYGGISSYRRVGRTCASPRPSATWPSPW